LKESDDIRCGEVDLLPTGVLKLRLPTNFFVLFIVFETRVRRVELTTSELVEFLVCRNS